VRALPLALLLAACSSGHPTLRIGLAGPFSDSVGAPMLRAAELAVRQINRAGGVGGRPLELLARDDHGDPDSAVTVAGDLVRAGVVAVIGHVYSGTTLAAAPVYNAAGVVEISPSSSAPAVTEAGEYTFRVCPSDRQMGAALARFAAERLGLRRGTILYLNDDYGRGLRQIFAAEFSRLGGIIDDVGPYLGQRPAVGPYLDRLVRRGTSQFIFIGGNREDAEEALRLARARGVRAPVLGGDGLEGLEEAGPLAEGSYIANAYLASFDSPENRAFVLEYMRQYPRAAPPNQPAAATWDAVHLLSRALARAGDDRSRVRDLIAAVGTTAPAYHGVTGEIAFDGNGDVPRQRVVIGEVVGGQVRAVEGL
jgi:branched-chain amino acid transport system substrate-binding protein